MSVYLDSKYLNLLSSRLRNFAKKKDALWNFSCPLCGDSTRDKRKARGYVFKMKEDLVFKCHNCGRSLLFANLLKEMDEDLHTQYLAERFTSHSLGRNVRKRDMVAAAAKAMPRTRLRFTPSVEGATRVSELEDGHPCKEFVESRLIPAEAHTRLFYTPYFNQFVTKHTNLYVDRSIKDDARLIIPFFDDKGKMTMFQGRSLDPNCEQKYRYMTIRLEQEPLKAFGLEKMNPAETVYVTEGPLDSLFLPNALATADSSLYKLREIADNVVLVYDNEPRNKDLVKIIDKSIGMGCNVVLWDESNPYKDINDMIMKGNRTVESVLDEIKRNTYSGLEATLRLMDWKKISA